MGRPERRDGPVNSAADPTGWADPARSGIPPSKAETYAAALKYVSYGTPLFPLADASKRPIIPSAHEGETLAVPCRGGCGEQGHGCYDATINPDRIDEWFHPDSDRFKGHPVAIGLATGGLFDVLDLDRKTGPDGLVVDGVETLVRYAVDHHLDLGAFDDPELMRAVWTPSGGTHLFVGPVGGAGNPAPIRGLAGCDWRARGGYVAAGPGWSAKHRRRYVPVPGFFDRQSPPCPPWLADLVRPPQRVIDMPAGIQLRRARLYAPDGRHVDGTAYAIGVLRRCRDEIAAAPDGTRNHTLNTCAFTVGQYVAGGDLRHDTAENELLGAAIQHGCSERKALGIIRSAFAAAASAPLISPPATTKRR